MITITSAVENALAQDSRTFLVKLWDGSTEVGGSVRALKVNKGSCGAEKFELGAVYSPYITATIDYDGATMDNLNGKELLVQIGVNVGTLDDPNYSYIDIGYFTVIKPQVQGTLVYITAYGRLSLLTDMYPTDSQQTLQQVLSTITTTTGMAVTVKGDLDLTGTVSGLSGWTILETLQIVAGLVGGYVTEDNAGGIVLASFDAYSETDTTRNPATIYVSNDNDFKALPTLLDAETVLDGITCYKSLAVGDAGADKFVYGTGLYEYANEYMTQTMFDNMTAKIGGWSHRAGVLNMAHGTPILEPWDAVQIIAGGVTFVIPCMSIEIVFDGGIACNVVSVGKTVADEETHFQGALSQRVARTLEVAQEAQDTAEEAKTIADNTAQYFWYTSTGSDTGAHITEIPSTDFLQNPSGGNLLARSNGIAVRDGLTELAIFGANEARIGKFNEEHIQVTPTQITVIGDDGAQIAYFGQTSRFGRATDSYVDVTPYHVELVRSTDGTLANRVSIASFGESIRVGKVGSGHTIIDGNGMEVLNGAKSLASFGATIRVGTISNSQARFIIQPTGMEFIYRNSSGTDYTLATIGNNGSSVHPYYTFGSRASGSTLGSASFTVGESNTASNSASVAMGLENTVAHSIAFAFGTNLTTGAMYQTVIGKYNASKSNASFIIGNGTSSVPSNAFWIDWDGYLYRGDTQIPIVVETGTSGGWQYAKWSDGRVELWGYFSQSATAYATNAFVIGSSSVTAYPFTITSPRTVATGQKIGTGGCIVTYDYGRTDYWSGIAHGPLTSFPSGSTQTITWTLYVNARWK